MDIDAFRTAHPEFNAASTELVQDKLDAAERRLSATAWGTRFDDAHGLLTAHLLWSSPFGASMRLEGGEQEKSSRYMKLLNELRVEVIDRVMVI